MSADSLVLGISCTMSDGAIALLRGSKVLLATPIGPKGVHNKIALKSALAALAANGFTLHDVDAFAADVGPGSFTGIRIALSLSRALAWSLSKAALPVFSLDVLARAAVRTIPDLPAAFAVGLDARKDFIYFALYDSGPDGPTRRAGPDLVEFGRLTEVVPDGAGLVGTGFARMVEGNRMVVSSDPPYVPEDFAAAVASAMAAGASTDWKGLAPLYLRRADAEDVLDRKNRQANEA
ncbi:MAG: tRNA (adenosine(37)-N6)-threonylcarbamoyltransferase complex dimerization subunit type 1 TsaB [Candidatus Brocadiia bacterium]